MLMQCEGTGNIALINDFYTVLSTRRSKERVVTAPVSVVITPPKKFYRPTKEKFETGALYKTSRLSDWRVTKLRAHMMNTRSVFLNAMSDEYLPAI